MIRNRRKTSKLHSRSALSEAGHRFAKSITQCDGKLSEAFCKPLVGQFLISKNKPRADRLPISFFLVLSITFTLWSCSTTDYFNEYKLTGQEGWHRDSVLSFNFVGREILVLKSLIA